MKSYSLKQLIRRVFRELFSPSRKFTLSILNILHWIRDIVSSKKKDEEKSPVLIWDIRVSTLTFDFLWLIFSAFYYYNKEGRDFDIVIYIPKEYQLKAMTWKSYNEVVSDTDLSLRVNNMILPMAKGFSCIKNLHVIHNRDTLLDIVRNKKRLIPKYYHPVFFSPPVFCYKKVHSMFKDLDNFYYPDIDSRNLHPTQSYSFLMSTVNSYITLTLRDYGFAPERNTKQSDIVKAFEFSKLLNCKLIIVPDDLTKLNYYTFNEDIIINIEARKNIENRFILYSNSLVNLVQPSGPAGASFFTKGSKSIVINFAKGSFDDNPKHYKKSYNFSIGDQPYISFDAYVLWDQVYPNYSKEDLYEAYNKLLARKTSQ